VHIRVHTPAQQPLRPRPVGTAGAQGGTTEKPPPLSRSSMYRASSRSGKPRLASQRRSLLPFEEFIPCLADVGICRQLCQDVAYGGEIVARLSSAPGTVGVVPDAVEIGSSFRSMAVFGYV
jgi:hypothetical protein